MITREVEGQELKYWDCTIGDKGEPVGWVTKPVKGSVTLPDSIDEILALGEAKIISLVQEALTASAMEGIGEVPQGAFSKAMVSAAMAAFRASPKFNRLQRSDLRDAIMNWLSKETAVLPAMLLAFEDLRRAPAPEEA